MMTDFNILGELVRVQNWHSSMSLSVGALAASAFDPSRSHQLVTDTLVLLVLRFLLNSLTNSAARQHQRLWHLTGTGARVRVAAEVKHLSALLGQIAFLIPAVYPKAQFRCWELKAFWAERFKGVNSAVAETFPGDTRTDFNTDWQAHWIRSLLRKGWRGCGGGQRAGCKWLNEWARECQRDEITLINGLSWEGRAKDRWDKTAETAAVPEDDQLKVDLLVDQESVLCGKKSIVNSCTLSNW